MNPMNKNYKQAHIYIKYIHIYPVLLVCSDVNNNLHQQLLSKIFLDDMQNPNFNVLCTFHGHKLSENEDMAFELSEICTLI